MTHSQGERRRKTSRGPGTRAPEVSDRFKEGMAVRRLIHGSDHVDEVWQAADGNDQKTALQDWITEGIWGALWTRNTLPLKTRSLLTIAFLVATNRRADLELHVRSAVLRNSCSMDEVREVMLHGAVYCGVAAATEAFEIADGVDREIPKAPKVPFKARGRRNQSRSGNEEIG